MTCWFMVFLFDCKSCMHCLCCAWQARGTQSPTPCLVQYESSTCCSPSTPSPLAGTNIVGFLFLTLYLTTVTIEMIQSIMIIMLVYFFCTLFLFVCSIKCIAQHRMHRRRGFRPPAVHFMLQPNRKSVQKKLTSKKKAIQTLLFQLRRRGIKGLIVLMECH